MSLIDRGERGERLFFLTIISRTEEKGKEERGGKDRRREERKGVKDGESDTTKELLGRGEKSDL